MTGIWVTHVQPALKGSFILDKKVLLELSISWCVALCVCIKATKALIDSKLPSLYRLLSAASAASGKCGKKQMSRRGGVIGVAV